MDKFSQHKYLPLLGAGYDRVRIQIQMLSDSDNFLQVRNLTDFRVILIRISIQLLF